MAAQVTSKLVHHKHEGEAQRQGQPYEETRRGPCVCRGHGAFAGVQARWRSARRVGGCRETMKDTCDPTHTKHLKVGWCTHPRLFHALLVRSRGYIHRSVFPHNGHAEIREGGLFFEVEIHRLIKTKGSPDQDSSSKLTPSGMTMASAVPHRRPAPRMETSWRLL